MTTRNNIPLPKTVFGFLQFFLRRHFLSAFLILSTGILCNLSHNVVLPYITGKLVDILNDISDKTHDTRIFFQSLGVGIGFWIILEAISRTKGLTSSHFIPKFEADIRLSCLKSVLKHEHEHFLDRQKLNAFSYRIDDLPRSLYMIFDNITNLFIPVIISIILSSLFLFDVHPILSSMFIAWLSIYIVVMVVLSKRSVRLTQTASQKRSRVQAAILDTIMNNFIIRALSKQHHEMRYISKIQGDEMRASRYSLINIELVKLCLGSISIISVSFLFFVAAKMWTADIISTGDVIFIVQNSMNIMSTMWFVADEITYTLLEAGRAKQSINVVTENVREDVLVEHVVLYSTHEEFLSQEDDISHQHQSDHTLVFDKVTFGYHDSKVLFSDLSVVIKQGERVGLVGTSGSGKTSFVNLIIGFYKKHGGELLIGSKKIEEYSPRELSQLISIMPQEVMLFNRSIRDNIAYCNHNIPFDKVEESAKLSQCHEFITSLENGYDTIIGEKGFSISGGQKQRIGIARTLIQNAPILIMDECTSSLDSTTDKKIQEALKMLMKNKTVIMIAHKLSTLQHIDRILVFNEGKIVEDGTHEQLMAKNGHYSYLWEMYYSRGGVSKV
ncbi:putative ABC transporter ATP-binding/permease [Candidatus Fokinia solitaria]|uniref:Putative ABC transporter ATP-binding/permease n=1 Tax=Candidatus Fokinia solitaria TaxID=1802984 RepID=A0A2U8BRC2_9RICK|nr:ABC transporter ATP-binding protein [Candidatus Fokinia solitaria]AWD32891.1 putative ABC transporter ATP-binding/permease [Candidatus Fokinia solitaria]